MGRCKFLRFLNSDAHSTSTVPTDQLFSVSYQKNWSQMHVHRKGSRSPKLRILLVVAGFGLLPLITDAAASPAIKAYLGAFKDNNIAVLDAGTDHVVKTIPVPSGPHGIVASPDGRKIYVSSDASSKVSVIDTATDQVTSSIDVGKGPHGLAITPNGRLLLVAVFGANQVVKIDTASNRVIGQVPVASPHNIAIRPTGNMAYVASQAPAQPSLAIIDLDRDALLNNVPVAKIPRALNFSPNGNLLYVTLAGVDAVQAIDPESSKLVAQIPVGGSPHDVVFTPDGRSALVVSQGPGTLNVIDTANNKVKYALPVGKAPHWIALSSNGRTAYITNEGSNNVAVVNLQTRKIAATIPVGNAPRKIALLTLQSQKTSSAAPQVKLHPAALPAQQNNAVTIAGFAFAPEKITIKSGQTVTWTNRDVMAHTVSGSKGDWDSGNLATGASYSKTFTKPGTYEYVCAIHPNMTGVVVVQ